MSVPKRFKTNKQLTNNRTAKQVLVRTNTIHILEKNLIFLNTTQKKYFNSHLINFYYKKRSSIVVLR